ARTRCGPPSFPTRRSSDLNDDGLGVAAVLEMARLFRQGPPPQRSVVFALWTGEERRLLGSETYAQHPVYPLANTVANLTFDILRSEEHTSELQSQSNLVCR